MYETTLQERPLSLWKLFRDEQGIHWAMLQVLSVSCRLKKVLNFWRKGTFPPFCEKVWTESSSTAISTRNIMNSLWFHCDDTTEISSRQRCDRKV